MTSVNYTEGNVTAQIWNELPGVTTFDFDFAEVQPDPCSATCTITLMRHPALRAISLQHGDNPEHQRMFPDCPLLKENVVPVRMGSGRIVAGWKEVHEWLKRLHEYGQDAVNVYG